MLIPQAIVQQGSGASFLTAAALYQHQLTSGTDGGSATSGSFQTRPLTVEVYDTGNLGTLSSNQVTLIAGTYQVQATAKFYQVGQHVLRVRNVTDGATLAVGESASSGGADTTATINYLFGRFTLASSKAIELQYFCEASHATNGLGQAVSSGEVEVFANLYLVLE